jgi:proteasome accessory factor A
MLKSLDLEYHNLNPSKGLYYGLLEEGRIPRVTTDFLIHLAMETAPKNTRAYGRSELVRHLLHERHASVADPSPTPDGLFPPYVINWSIFQVRGHAPFPMPDPFKTYLEDVRTHLDSVIV